VLLDATFVRMVGIIGRYLKGRRVGKTPGVINLCEMKWSGRWESNPRLKLGKLGYYHYTTPA
jgi:hypothetical protein